MDVFDDLGFGEHQQVVATLEVARPVLEALAAERGFVELVLLDHGAHGTVEDDDAFREQFPQVVRATIHWLPCASPKIVGARPMHGRSRR